MFDDNENAQGMESASEAETGNTDPLNLFANEDGSPKYKSLEDAAKGWQNAQEHIKKLEEENRTFRSELDKRLSAEKVLEEIKATTNHGEKPSQDVSTDAIMDLVDKRLTERTVQETMQANQKAVKKALEDKYGAKAGEVFKSTVEKLGLNAETVTQLAGQSPQAVLAMFGTQTGNVPSKTESSVRTEQFSQPNVRNYAYYRNLRKNDPRAYTSNYMQMLRDAESQGQDFYK